MKISIIKKESKELVLEFSENDLTIPELVADKLNENEDVQFAGVSLEHPEVGRPQLVLKTDKKKALDVLNKALDDIEEDFSDLKSQLSKKK